MSINRNGKRAGEGPDDRLKLGREGEQAAAEYLVSKGMQIVERNWRTRRGEVDLIVRDGEYICFVEVRTKMLAMHGHPLETITEDKQRQVIQVAMQYLQKHGLEESAVRFDAVGVVKDGEQWRISHIPGAFEADDEW